MNEDSVGRVAAIARHEGRLERSVLERRHVRRSRPVVFHEALAPSALGSFAGDYVARRGAIAVGQRTVTTVRVLRSATEGSPSLPVAPPCPLIDERALVLCELFAGLDHVTDGHQHPKLHALLYQLEGTKEVVLYPPREASRLYPRRLYDGEFHTSRVDFFHPDARAFPRFTGAHRLETTLTPGDALFIPVGWWHAVRGTGRTTSLSYFWSARARDQGSLAAALRNELGSAIARVRGSISRRWPRLGARS